MRLSSLALSALMLLSGCVTSPAAPFTQAASDSATLVILHARVWTGNPKQPWAEAVAVRGDRLVAVGSSSELARLAGTGTRVIDAQGRMLVPGFNDAHLH